MNIYSVMLFLHIAGALGSFVTLGLEWTSLHQIKNAVTSEQVRAWISIFNGTRRFGMVSMVTIVAAGIYLMASAWGSQAWIIVTLGAMVLMVVLINTFTRPRTLAIARAVTDGREEMPPIVRSLANDPLLWISIQTRVAISLGIVFLMTVKPGVGGSLITIVVSIVMGLASSLPMIRHKYVQERTVD